MRRVWNCILAMTLAVTFYGCGTESGNGGENIKSETTTYRGMDGDVADLEYNIVTIKKLDGSKVEVDLNGLKVEAVKGAQKDDSGNWNIIDRRGVRMNTIFAKAGLNVADDQAVTFIGRDGYDVFRTKLKNDADKLPKFNWMKQYGYVYVGNGGNKDPLYPLHEGKTLNVDYDLAADNEVPENIGTAIGALSNLRALMIEKVDDSTYGLIELVVTAKDK